MSTPHEALSSFRLCTSSLNVDPPESVQRLPKNDTFQLEYIHDRSFGYRYEPQPIYFVIFV